MKNLTTLKYMDIMDTPDIALQINALRALVIGPSTDGSLEEIV